MLTTGQKKEINKSILQRLLRKIYWDRKTGHKHYTRPWVFQAEAVILIVAASACLLWQRIYIDQPHTMHFEDVRLREIVHRIEDKFNVTVIAENAALYECLVTVDLTDQSLKNILHLISGTLAVQYQQQGRTIVLKGGECR